MAPLEHLFFGSVAGPSPSHLPSFSSVATFSLTDFKSLSRPNSTIHASPAATVYVKILSPCVIKSMQFPVNVTPIVRARTYMIYSWLWLFQGASVENMMERVTALLLKSVWMIESGVVVKWAWENVAWFLSLKFWQYSFFLWFSRGYQFIVRLSGIL